ncbi:Protein TusC [Buchnera aphidicola (Thelaxes suberi)]|uniref:sulfurtransferase complex subunit TusC n=1 Tax=Buchnera aphidicola TaxID=9 RepID=UPI0034642415
MNTSSFKQYKSFAIIFSSAPYENNIGYEGLNIALVLASLEKKISLFFLEDGIFQILNHQNPNYINCHNSSLSFKIFKMYKLINFYISIESLQKRGLFSNNDFIVPVNIFNISKISEKIKKCNFILKF